MGRIVKSAPAFLPEGTQDIMRPSLEENLHALSRRHCARQPNCDVPLYIGVFFDGTNNNRERDEPDRCHTNVVRLYNAHPAVDAPPPGRREMGHYRIYVPGVGTRFDANEEWRESMEGTSMARGSQARILFGLLEVVNAVHKAFANDQPLFQPDAITEKLYDYVLRVEQGVKHPHRDNVTERESRRAWMQRLAAEVQASIRKAHGGRERPHYPFIRVNVFGFSRGAAQARAFCYWLNELVGKDRQLADIPVQLGFVGLFDCVASVGLSHSVTPEAKAEKLLAIVREVRENGPQGLPPYQRSVYDAYEKERREDVNLRAMIEDRLDAEKEAVKGAIDRRERLQAQAKYSKESVFRPDEQARAAALFPVQKDEHAATIPEGIEKVARLITDTRQEGGGYLLPRAFFMGDK